MKSDWKNVALGEVARVFNGKTPSKAEQRSEGHPVLKIRDVSELGEYRGKFESFVDAELAAKFSEKRVCDGDTLILNAAHNADYVASKTYRAQPPTFGALATGEWLIVRPGEKSLDGGFVHHWVTSTHTRRQLRELVNGIHLYPKDVARLKIPLPPLAEQRRIAEVLDRAEALRAKRRAALAQLDSLTQSLFLDLFGDPATNPKGWPVSGIDDVCELIVDCVNRTAPIVDGPTPFKMIRTSNVKSGKVNLASVRYVTEEIFIRWNRRTTPRRGDVLLTREAPVGEAGMIESDDAVFLGQRLMLYRSNRDRMTPEYMLASFRGAFLLHQFNRYGSGSTVKHLPLPACRSFQVHVPPITLQREFTRRVTAVEALKTAQRASLAELDALFATLQHRAFKGEL